MARITFSIEDPLAEAAEKVAAKERRSLSSYITLLVERDLETKSLLPGSPAAGAMAKARSVLDAVGPAAFEAHLEQLRATVAAGHGEEVSS